MDLAIVKKTMLIALKGAGRMMRSSLHERQIVAKKTELSLVTATDEAAETFILQTIQSTFPNHAFLAEESLPQGESEYRWIIDPLDGTTNFAHTYPVACVSIAFEHAGILTAAGVYDPFRNELFYAEKDRGATMNGHPIHVSATPTLEDALICTGFPYDRRERLDRYLNIVRDFLMQARDIRRSGSAALDLCYVACGRFDGFWEFQLQPWDKAAGILIVREAGGIATTYRGEPLNLESGQNLVSNHLIHDELLNVLKPYKHLEK